MELTKMFFSCSDYHDLHLKSTTAMKLFAPTEEEVSRGAVPPCSSLTIYHDAIGNISIYVFMVGYVVGNKQIPM
jgi:hypothetical protein